MKCYVVKNNMNEKRGRHMKWNNKGHELDSMAEGLIQSFSNKKKIYIFGAGFIGR